MSSKRKNTDGPKVTLEYAKADVDASIEGPFLGTNLVSYSSLLTTAHGQPASMADKTQHIDPPH